VTPLASHRGPISLACDLFALGAALILAEIILAEVRFSQIGNILILVAGIAFARLLLRDQEAVERDPSTDGQRSHRCRRPEVWECGR
jgi:hypothetical protein